VRTPWGNSFKVGGDGNRVEVICKYRDYFAHNRELVGRAREELRGKVLGCWCKPEACHGDVLVELINLPAASPLAAGEDGVIAE
jgi:Domain of unknown function (DUF4326)